MYRIGIVGSENSHAMAFSKIYNADTEESKALGLRVVAVMGEEREASQKVFDECGLEFIAEKPEDMLGKVDAVMITSRDGGLHPGYARPFIEAGLPLFVDKPVANKAADAQALVQLCKKHGVPVMGGSSTKLVPDTLSLRDRQAALAAEGKALGGAVWAPVSMDNIYGGFYFYASHLVEISMTIFGYAPLSVTAQRVDTGVIATLYYKDFPVSLHFTEGAYNYGAVLLGKEGADMQAIDISDCYRLEAVEFAHMVASGKSPISSRELVQPVFVMEAIEKAYLSGGREAVGVADV